MQSFTVPTEGRDAFLENVALGYRGYVQRLCNSVLVAACENQPAGFWEYRTLIKGDLGKAGGFLVPTLINPTATMSAVSQNGWRGAMTPEAMGICASLTTFSLLSFRALEYNHLAAGQRVSDSFHALREASYNHREAEAIVAFCD